MFKITVYFQECARVITRILKSQKYGQCQDTHPSLGEGELLHHFVMIHLETWPAL